MDARVKPAHDERIVCPLRPRLCSAPLRKGYALRCVRGTVKLLRRTRWPCRCRRVRAAEAQYEAGAGVFGIALDAGIEFLRHCGDDALAHAGGARIGLDVEADAVVGNRQFEIVTLRDENDM